MPVQNASDPEYSTWVDFIGENGTDEENQFSMNLHLDEIDEIDSYKQVIEFCFL